MKNYLEFFKSKNLFFSFIAVIFIAGLFFTFQKHTNTNAKGRSISEAMDDELELGDGVLICPGDSYQLNTYITPEADENDLIITWSHPGFLEDTNDPLSPIVTPPNSIDLVLTVNVKFKNLVENGNFNTYPLLGFNSGLTYIPGSIAVSEKLDEGEFTIGVDPHEAYDQMFSCDDNEESYNMMIINASDLETEILWEQVINDLTPGNDYTFSAWYTNLKAKEITTIQFFKDDAPMTSPITILGGPDYLCVWQNQTFTFTANSSSVEMTIKNIDGQAKGDDFALDRISLIREDDVFTDVITIDVAEHVEALVETVPSCYEQNNGSLKVLPTSGMAPFTFNWASPITTSTDTLSELVPNNYQVTITDFYGCTASKNILVTEYPPLQWVFEVKDVSCFGGSDGEVFLNASQSGCTNLSYQWSNGETIEVLSSLVSGDYSVTVTDCQSCSEIISVFVPQPDLVQTNFNGQSPTCYGNLDGFIKIDTITGGTPPFTISKDSVYLELVESFPFFIEDIGSGDFNYILTDDHDCTEQVFVQIPSPPEVTVVLGGEEHVLLGESVHVSALLSGNIDTVYWEGVGELSCLDCPDPYIIPYQTGPFTLIAVDHFGCTDSDEIFFYVDKPSIFLPNIFSPNEDGINDRYTPLSGPGVHRIKSMRIFNRWGDIIFKAFDFPPNNTEFGWDGTFKGKLLNPGVFICLIEMEYVNGEVLTQATSVTLMR